MDLWYTTWHRLPNYYFTKRFERERWERESERKRDTAAPLSIGLEVDGCQSLIEDWIRTGKMNGRYCIKEDFVIFQCFFDLYFEESWFARDFFFPPSFSWFGNLLKIFWVWIWNFIVELNLGQTLFFFFF